MSLIENLRKSPAPKYVLNSAEAIAAKITEAEASLADLENQRDSASFAAYEDRPGGKAALAKLNGDVATAKESIALLRSAHRGALERDKQALLALKKDAIETAFRSVTSSLAIRDKAADLYAASIADASKHYRAMQSANERARQAWTAAGMEWPTGAVTENDLKHLAAGEGWRHTSGDIGGDPLMLPAPAFSQLEFQHNPTAMERIDKTLRDDSAWIKEQISKKVPK